MEKLARYLTRAEAAAWLGAGAEVGASEYALVRNLDFVPAPRDIYPLAPRVRPPLPRIVAFAVDMDGTSTTTEPLALHALEYMVRRITGRPERAQWAGLDPQLDYPHVIGNSNFRHTEYLVQRYHTHVNAAAFAQAFIEALAWTLACMPDSQRRRAVTQNARHCGLRRLLEDGDFRRVVASAELDADNVGNAVRPFASALGPTFRPEHDAALVAAALDIYYMRYHAILRRLEAGEGPILARELLGDAARPLVEPMPGYDVFVALIKGWLGPEVDALFEPLREHLLADAALGHTREALDAGRPRLTRLARRFRRQPAKLALVTASIAYEMRTCLRVVMDALVQRVQAWPVPTAERDRIAQCIGDEVEVFDALVNASDACETRLKPHRDLYSLALFDMSVARQDYPLCVGLEDTEPGIIALRAAGLGCAVALPNRDTHGQDYTAATEVIRGGLPELILARNLLLEDKADGA